MRSRPLLVLAAFFASLTASAQAVQARPKLVVLGLEVTGECAPDQKTTEAAKALTRELRREAARAGGPFEMAPNGNKDLLEMRLLSDCGDESRRCMTEIGKQLRADRLIYGKLERTKRGYSVSLRLLDVDNNAMAGQQSEVIPFADATASGGLQRRARSLYGRLVGSDEDGAIAISATTGSGTVYVDGKLRTNLSGGSARVSGLSDGVHTVAIESDGHARFEAEVNVEAGETSELDATLVALGGSGDDSPDRPGSGWRIAFWSGVVATGVAGAGWTYTGLSVLSAQDDVKAALASFEGNDDELPPGRDENGRYDNTCEAFRAPAAMDFDPSVRDPLLAACDRGDSREKLVNFLWIPATAASAIFTGYAYYKGYMAPRGITAEREARRRARSRTRVTVTPALGPNLVGAGLELTF